MKIFLGLCFVVFGCLGIDPVVEDKPKKSYLVKRAIDGSRGRKYYEPEEEDTFEIYQSDDNYDSYDEFADIRKNVPGEPGIDYPAHRRIPQTSFTCDTQYRGYYADEEAGCQLFHVCDGNFLISSFLCPIGSIFSQKVLTCDWWNKVDCSLTKNYYTINSQSSEINDADDDDILRKAYEMTSHHSIKNENTNKKNNEISSSNDLQTGPNNFPDYDKVPRLEYQQQKKFSSRYSAVDANDYYSNLSDDNSSNSAIKVHTIGEDYKNDVDNNRGRVRPSYMPTVPTVTTTRKTYYSPTVPTTTSRSMKYDLEFESSDHLYSARGKTLAKSTTITPNNYEIIDDKSSSNIFDDLSTKIRGEESSNKNKILPTQSTLLNSKNDEISSSMSLLKSLKDDSEVKNSKKQDFIINEFENLDLGVNSPEEVIKNYSKLVSLEEDNYQIDKNIFVPPTNIIPPFFYYSSIEQHNAVTDKTSEITETNSTTSWFDTINIDVPVTDIIPPSFYYRENDESNNKPSDKENLKSEDKLNNKIIVGKNYSVITRDFKTHENLSREIANNSSNSGNNIESIFEVENSTENIPTPSKIFLPPLFKFFIQNASGFLQNYQYDLNSIKKYSGENFDLEREIGGGELSGDDDDDGKLVDSTESESSPYRVTFNIAEIGGLDYEDEFSKSQSNLGDESHQDNLENIKNRDSDVTEDKNGPENDDDQVIEASRFRTVNYSSRNSSKSREIPRPTLRFSSQEFGRKNSESTSVKSNIIDPGFLSEKINIPAGIRRGKSEPQRVETRGRGDQNKNGNINFNLPKLSRKFNFQSGSRVSEIPVESEGDKISDKNKMGVEKSKEKSGGSFVFDTEVIPSLGFSLDTDEERKKFMDAIIKGFITDVTIESTNKSATSAGKL